MYARIGNLSEGGLFVRTSTPLARGAKAKLRFKNGDQPEVATLATVVWTSQGDNGTPPGMGLRFDGVDERARELIQQIIQSEHQIKLDVG